RGKITFNVRVPEALLNSTRNTRPAFIKIYIKDNKYKALYATWINLTQERQSITLRPTLAEPRGYTDREIDLKSICLIGIQVSLQEEPIKYRGPALYIESVVIEDDKAPVTTKLPLSLRKAEPAVTIPVTYEEFKANSGVNYAWSNYGRDFGKVKGWGHIGFSRNINKLRADFKGIKAAGMGVVRMFIFADTRGGIVFDENGMPIRFDRYVYKDFEAVLKVAKETGLRLCPFCLISGWLTAVIRR
ncbi:MAG: hypothetical protein DRP85_08955, partial [Candidatus Makaraimicrobium thalassicum]